ncbi:MAG: pyridoxine 5'-phosphate synthase [Kiritimatiellae bacterium]|nr:pyridoxine 5'-phosphate synthase [Kiritimatiellia bacterium]
MHSRLKLGVNVDHVATVRQARGTDYPSPVAAAELCMASGAESITMHLREDRRHIQDADVLALSALNHIPLNLEMAATEEMTGIALKVRPQEVCLVPEKRQELTTEGGLDVAGRKEYFRTVVNRLTEAGVRVSLFITHDAAPLEAATDVGAPVVELHTGAYCDAIGGDRDRELEALIAGARDAHERGLQVNAGHGINLNNLPGVLEIPWMDTLNIGHSLVARAVMIGLPEAVREMRAAMDAYRGGRS